MNVRDRTGRTGNGGTETSATEAAKAPVVAAEADRSKAEETKTATDKENKVKLDEFFSLNTAELQEKRLEERMALQ